jgi:NAD(P)-dependent dehydrogenase (short-subunit alcohol dehydrogenase family)
MSLSSLRDGYRAMVFGASGGIGAAIAHVLTEDPRCAHVHAGARSALEVADNVSAFSFELTDEATIAKAADQIGAQGPIDLVIVATGVLHGAGLQPEKAMRALDAAALSRSFAINAIGPALIAKHFLPLMPRDRKSVFAALSARVGSIGDNRSGGWHAYRASKAALNQLIRTCAIELAARNKHAVCVTLHPGTVDTTMSQPFSASVATGTLFTPEVSARHLLQVMDGLSPVDTAGFFAWDGKAIPY